MTGPVTTRYFQGPDGKYYKLETTPDQENAFRNVRSNEALSVFLQAAENKVEVQQNDIPADAERFTIEGETTQSIKEATVDRRRTGKNAHKVEEAKARVDNSVYFTPDQKDEYETKKAELEGAGKRPVLLTENDMKTLEKYGLGKAVKTEGDKRTIDSALLKEESLKVVGDDYILDTKERKAGFFEWGAQRKERKLFERLGYDVQFKKSAYTAPVGIGLAAAGITMLAKSNVPLNKLRNYLAEKLHLSDDAIDAIMKKVEVNDFDERVPGSSGTVSHNDFFLRKGLGWALLGLGGALFGGGLYLDRSMKKENQVVTETKEGFTYFEKAECEKCNNQGKVVVPPIATVDHEADVEVTNTNTPYKMKKGDTLANVIKAKYGITDPKELRAAIKEIRRVTGIPENGIKDGVSAIPHIEVDGKTWKDAYWLPDKILDGKYALDNTKNATPIDYTKQGVAVQGKKATTTQAANGDWVTKDPDGNELYRGKDMKRAYDKKDEYDANQRRLAQQRNNAGSADE